MSMRIAPCAPYLTSPPSLLPCTPLFQILSETKDPQRVQPFLRKIFEGINGLEFKPDMSVMAMISEEGERVSVVFSS
jgi:hypothetical protein